MLTWAELTDEELAECTPLTQRTIERLNARIDASLSTLLAIRPPGSLTRDQIEAELSESLRRWEQSQVTVEAMRGLMLDLAICEVLRAHRGA